MLGFLARSSRGFGGDWQLVSMIILAILKCDDHLGHIIVAASRLDPVHAPVAAMVCSLSAAGERITFDRVRVSRLAIIAKPHGRTGFKAVLCHLFPIPAGSEATAGQPPAAQAWFICRLSPMTAGAFPFGVPTKERRRSIGRSEWP